MRAQKREDRVQRKNHGHLSDDSNREDGDHGAARKTGEHNACLWRSLEQANETGRDDGRIQQYESGILSADFTP